MASVKKSYSAVGHFLSDESPVMLIGKGEMLVVTGFLRAQLASRLYGPAGRMQC